jgi:hypothetical protein
MMKRLLALFACLFVSLAFANPGDAFLPDKTGTVSLSVTGSSGRVAITPNRTQYTLYNAGSTIVFVEFGDNTITSAVPSGATPGGFPVAPGAIITISIQAVAGVMPTNIAAIGSAAGPSTLYISSGAGN